MGQHKFEDQIRRQLQDREITPSANAWNKLNERLEKEEKKSKSYYWILGIAASFAAGILILSLVFNNNNIEDTPTIVDTPVESVEKEIEDNALEEKENIKEPLNSNLDQIAAEEVKKPETNKVIKSITAPVVVENAEQQIASIEDEREVQEELKTEITTAERDEILPQRLEEVIAVVSSEVNSNGDMTEAEVDALLYKAAVEISLQRERESFSGKVDATGLLMEVEMELDQGFRKKVFDILKEGYLKARTAVANRNF